MIPKNIFQTHKSRQYRVSIPILSNALHSWKRNKHFKHYFSNDYQCDEFIRIFFPEIKDVYDRLPMKVMKADLWRYCIIYKYGGIYADTDTVLKVDPLFLTNHNNKELVVVPEDDVHFCQWVFAAPANSAILKSIIDLSVERIRNTKEIKGEHIIHYLTGPGVFTDGIIRYFHKNKINIKNVGHLNSHSIDQYDNRNIYQYENNFIDNIFVFNTRIFHRNMVIHIGSGNWDNGWKNERYRILT